MLQGLLALAPEHHIGMLKHACGRVVHVGIWRLKELRRLDQDVENDVLFDFLKTHPLILNLSHYQLETRTNTKPSSTIFV